MRDFDGGFCKDLGGHACHVRGGPMGLRGGRKHGIGFW